MQVRSDKLDLTKAKFSPSRYFDTPWQVVAHEQLTHGDKIEILTQWESSASISPPIRAGARARHGV